MWLADAIAFPSISHVWSNDGSEALNFDTHLVSVGIFYIIKISLFANVERKNIVVIKGEQRIFLWDQDKMG